MTIKKLLDRYLPNPDWIKKQSSLRFLSSFLNNTQLWTINRQSSSGGAAIGMFCAFIPAPIHSICAVSLAILFRVNVPLAFIFSLFSNPITIPPLFYFTYQIGAKILGLTERTIEFTLSMDWLSNTLVHIWKPLLLGCLLVGSVSALITYFSIRLIWRFNVVNQWERRQDHNHQRLLDKD